MTFDTVPISFSLVLTIFLALYVARSAIFLFVARNIIKLGANLETACHCAALDTQFNRTDYKPFVSVLIASYNEQQVIDRLMKSCAALTYNQNKFEIIVVDDSDDETFHILKNWEKKIQNLKVIHRSNRKGWKGGALNVALNNMNPKSSYALIVDADNVLPSRILESFVSRFNECSLKEKNIVEVIQGYPIPTVYYNNNNDNNSKLDTFDQVGDYSNWVSKAIDFRLAKRNLIEFMAKDKLSLPIQITGSLFMMRSEVIKLLGFSEDLTEDWDLTLDLYLSPDGILPYYSNCGDRLQGSNIGTRKVFYDPALTSYSSTITKFRAYFRQRMRVSEGHTRGFRKNIINILTSNIRVKDKIEFFFVGLQYSKFIAVVTLIIIDLILLLSAILSVAIGVTFMALDVCATIRSYNIKDVLNSLFLSLCTIPAFVMGSLYGLFEDEGIFYKTERSIY
jgi:cellulose synthase/poly-beta-1,6-N-acetylglucosamine synthase-like glycosyltransferase